MGIPQVNAEAPAGEPHRVRIDRSRPRSDPFVGQAGGRVLGWCRCRLIRVDGDGEWPLTGHWGSEFSKPAARDGLPAWVPRILDEQCPRLACATNASTSCCRTTGVRLLSMSRWVAGRLPNIPHELKGYRHLGPSYIFGMLVY